MRIVPRATWPTVIALLVAMQHSNAAVPRFSIAEITGFPGDEQVVVNDLNNRGQVVGYSRGSGTIRALLWQDGVAMDFFPDTEALSQAFSINDTGMVLLYSSNRPALFAWQNGRVLFDLKAFRGSTSASGLQMNERGDVAGLAEIDVDGTPCGRPVLWPRGERPLQLKAVSGCDNIGVATGINNRGQVVGWWSHARGYDSFVWANGKGHEIRGMDNANAINDCGWVLGGEHDGTDEGQALWRKGKFYRFGAWQLFPIDLNNYGDLVGQGPHGAAKWQRGKRLDLNRLVDRSNPGVADIHLAVAWHINDRGQIIATSDTSPERYFLLTPKESDPDQKPSPFGCQVSQ